MSVYCFQYTVIPPSAPLHYIGIWNSYGMLDACRVMPEIVEAEVWQAGSFEDVLEFIGNLVWIEFYDAAFLPFELVSYELGKVYIPVSGI